MPAKDLTQLIRQARLETVCKWCHLHWVTW